MGHWGIGKGVGATGIHRAPDAKATNFPWRQEWREGGKARQGQGHVRIRKPVMGAEKHNRRERSLAWLGVAGIC